MIKLVLLRHGESTWNRENLFTGWTDVDLSDRGREEAREAGRLLRDGGYVFDVAFTSVLKRAIRTLDIALDAFRHDFHPQFVCHLDDMRRDDAGCCVLCNGVDK